MTMEFGRIPFFRMSMKNGRSFLAYFYYSYVDFLRMIGRSDFAHFDRARELVSPLVTHERIMRASYGQTKSKLTKTFTVWPDQNASFTVVTSYSIAILRNLCL